MKALAEMREMAIDCDPRRLEEGRKGLSSEVADADVGIMDPTDFYVQASNSGGSESSDNGEDDRGNVHRKTCLEHAPTGTQFTHMS